MMRDYVAQKDAELVAATAQLVRLVALLPQCPTPGDEILLRAEIANVAEIASSAANCAKAYRERAASMAVAARFAALGRKG